MGSGIHLLLTMDWRRFKVSEKINSDKINSSTLALMAKALESGHKYIIHPDVLGKRNMDTLKKTLGEGFKAEPYGDGKSGFLVLTVEKGGK